MRGSVNKAQALLQGISPSLRESLEYLTLAEGIPLDDLFVMAIAEKVARSEHSAWLAERRSSARHTAVPHKHKEQSDQGRKGFALSAPENTALTSPKGVEERERQRIADLFESAPVFLALLSGPDHVFEVVNQAYRELLGNRVLVGRRVVDGVPELAGTACMERLDRVYASGETLIERDSRFSFVPTQGHPPEDKYIDYAYKPRRAADGTITGILVLGVDTSLVHQLVQGTMSEAATLENMG
jgi:PAS domain-containing protein